MNLISKNILLISPEPWSHIFVSKHHYAINLACRGNNVYFLNPPSDHEKCEKTDFENLYSINYTGFVKGLRFLPSFIQKIFIRRCFKALQRLCNVRFDIVWSFDNSVFFDFSALPKDIFSISHVVDLNQDFQFKKAVKTANICFGVIKKIVDKQLLYNRNSFQIGHGVQNYPKSSKVIKLPGKNSKKCLHIGNLAMKHIDWNLYNQCIADNSGVDFIFIGSNNLPISQKNCFKINTIPANRIPDYLMSADILWLAYKVQYYQEYATPHKMMEYLASGKMILATWTEEYVDLHYNGLIKMSRNSSQFLKYFDEITVNLDFWNNEDLTAKRKAYTADFTYTNQVRKIEELIKGEHL